MLEKLSEAFNLLTSIELHAQSVANGCLCTVDVISYDSDKNKYKQLNDCFYGYNLFDVLSQVENAFGGEYINWKKLRDENDGLIAINELYVSNQYPCYAISKSKRLKYNVSYNCFMNFDEYLKELHDEITELYPNYTKNICDYNENCFN